jgi:hypothetical protein
MSKHDKKGPELFQINTEMLHGIEVMAAMYKQHHDFHNYDFLMAIKTGLSKTIAVTPEVRRVASELRTKAKEMVALADWLDLVFPQYNNEEPVK